VVIVGERGAHVRALLDAMHVSTRDSALFDVVRIEADMEPLRLHRMAAADAVLFMPEIPALPTFARQAAAPRNRKERREDAALHRKRGR
jgi:hypothetical protein